MCLVPSLPDCVSFLCIVMLWCRHQWLLADAAWMPLKLSNYWNHELNQPMFFIKHLDTETPHRLRQWKEEVYRHTYFIISLAFHSTLPILWFESELSNTGSCFKYLSHCSNTIMLFIHLPALRMECRVSHMLDKHCTTELYPQPNMALFCRLWSL